MTGKETSFQIWEPTSIDGSHWRRALTLAAIKLCEHWRPRSGSVLFLTDRICVKYGSHQHITEAATMQFIAEETSIPVPKVYCTFSRKGQTYIVMERINGQRIRDGWNARSEESRKAILQQIRSMIAEMRNIVPPPTIAGVASVTGGSLYDGRLPNTSTGRFGPFPSVSAFHHYLRRGLYASSVEEVMQLINMYAEISWPLRFTHADLSSFNILARGDRVVGLVDWESAGWYPSYWEYTSASNVNPYNEFWRHEVDNVLEPLPKELAMDTIRIKYFSDFPWGWGRDQQASE